MKELSIFVDESGDFGEYERHAPYYIVTMVFHDQAIDISNNINILNNSLKNSFVFHKGKYKNKYKLEARIAKELMRFIREILSFFKNYNSQITYQISTDKRSTAWYNERGWYWCKEYTES